MIEWEMEIGKLEIMFADFEGMNMTVMSIRDT
jgi:hypothetical protein